MKTSIWYHTADRQPSKTGAYLCYRGFGMGGMSDYDHHNGYLWYDKKSNSWYEYDDCINGAIVYYWTDADPDAWVEADPPVVHRKNYQEKSHPALQEAWKNVQEAIERYEVLKALTNEYKL